MVEGEGPALPLPLEHFPGQDLILLEEDGQVLSAQGLGIAGRADHRLHAELGKAQIGHVEDVVGEVQIMARKGAAHVIILAAPRVHQLPESGHDAVIAALSGVVHAQAVVHLLPSVQAEHDVAHLPVGEVDHVVVDQHAVRGQRKAEVSENTETEHRPELR